MADLYKYGVAVHLYKPIIKRAVVDFAVGADWTPAAGDVKISKDGGAAANVTNLPTAITMGNTAMWDFSLTATEMQAAKIRISVSDSATKAVEDTFFEIDTYGNASAEHAIDLDDAVRAGLTALPNANAEAAGGLFTRGSGAGQINQPANGLVDVNVERWNATAVPAEHTAGYPIVTVKDGTGTGEIDTDSGRVAVTEAQVDQIVDEVWDEATSGHTTAGSTGKALTDAGSAGDPWSTALPGAYGAGTAGKIVGDNLDATISSRASQTSLDTLDDYVDTEVAAIKTKTDQLTFTNANKLDASILAVADFAAAVANKIADHTLRRTYANARASSDGDTFSFRSLMGAIAKLVNKWTISSGTLTIYHEDDTTSAGTQTVTTNSAAEPITSLDT